MIESQIIQNAAKITDNGKITYIQSCHVHDYVTYEFDDGESFSIDGGRHYCKRCWTSQKALDRVECFVLSDASLEKDIRYKLLWGSLVNGKVVFRPIKELTMEHLQAILDTQHGIGCLHKKIITYWLKQRIKHLEKVVSRTTKSK